jgi:hypothetical protein
MTCLVRARFILVMPNGSEMLVTSNDGWHGLTDFVKYFDSEYSDDIKIKPVSLCQSFKFWLGGKYASK